MRVSLDTGTDKKAIKMQKKYSNEELVKAVNASMTMLCLDMLKQIRDIEQEQEVVNTSVYRLLKDHLKEISA